MNFLDFLEIIANQDEASVDRMFDKVKQEAIECKTKEVLLQLATDVLVKINPDIDQVESLINDSVKEFIGMQSEKVQNNEDLTSLVYLAGEALLDTMKEHCSPKSSFEVATVQ